MILARVTGTVVSSQKASQMEGLKLLLLEKIDPVSMQGKNDFIVAMDGVGAGVDEIVFYVSGSSARMAESTKGLPTDATVVAIVDLIELKGTLTYQKR
ncbi:MAG: ethanolamine utilization protein EutN [Bacteroidetes bacterium CG18_big_fil_WC_8_21_14_2_50_41_14]|nr:MAG: ethanolamine utilization protein EutN [Bacteroidetes bacterium CG18_big_fil_WC_8_21_14_2_50_41_14]PIY30651.1 MAG: ethanolamine utilization protein EutN [Bacteroidetes bacterium CG_4_10_14_3_um_filter_42_6]PJB58874.1 MAG: ethanolamine utilization protein EutN [Bacteroidetes bacterium CG_4_9_14_3_um_filter_41_19]